MIVPAASSTHWVTRTTPAGRLAFALLLVAALALGGWWGSKRVMWSTPTGHQIATVVRAGASVNETILTPPQARHNTLMTRTQMAAYARWAQHDLSRYFTGRDLVFWKQIARVTLNPRQLHHGKDSQWMTWGRVDWVHLSTLEMLPGSRTATATASVEVSSNGGAINRSNYVFDLVKTEQGWRIASETSAYQLGWGP